MFRIIIIGTMTLVAAAAAVAQPNAAERIGQPPLHGFTLAIQDARGGNSIAEWLPHGETLIRWTKMVTVQRFGGLAATILPAAYLERIRTTVQAACPGATASAIAELIVSGRPAAQIRADCPMNPRTGRPETFFMRAIAGARDMHVVQVAFRHRPTRDDIGFAQRHLAATILCAPGSTERLCRD